MSRRRRRPSRTDAPLRGGWLRVEPGADPDDDWVVRSVSGSAAAKDYRCPGCGQEIRAGTPHVVAWPAREPEGTLPHAAERSCGAGGATQERRHWHTACWRRGRR